MFFLQFGVSLQTFNHTVGLLLIEAKKLAYFKLTLFKIT